MSSLGLTPQQTAIILAGPKNTSTTLRILQFVAQAGDDGATSDECRAALDLSHESGSARFTELTQAGCLQPTNQRRRTRAGGTAKVFVVVDNVDFAIYLRYMQLPRAQKHTDLSRRESMLLSASENFVQQWAKTKTNKQREQRIKKLITTLLNTNETKKGKEHEPMTKSESIKG